MHSSLGFGSLFYNSKIRVVSTVCNDDDCKSTSVFFDAKKCKVEHNINRKKLYEK